VAFVRRDVPHRVRMAAWSLAGFTLLVLAAALVLAGIDASRMTAGRVIFTPLPRSRSSCTRGPDG
jgi:hypothetical protein